MGSLAGDATLADVPYIVVHYNEISLKGKNQPLFLHRLEANLRRAMAGTGVYQVFVESGRMVLPLPEGAPWDVVRERLGLVFGVANFALAERVDLDLAALKEAVGRALADHTFRTFRVSTRRAF